VSARLDFDSKHLQGLLSQNLIDLLELGEDGRRDFLAALDPEELRALPYIWEFWARPEQVWRPDRPEDERIRIWLYQAGRGWGKTRVGAQAVLWVEAHAEEMGFGRPPLTESAPVIALVARTAHDAIATMIKGPSGILACSPPWNRPHFMPSEKCLIWPSGLRAYYFTAERPEQLRGPNIGFAWADEVAFYKALRGFAVGVLENIEQALRSGSGKAVFTTTPLPTAAMFALHERSKPREAVSKRPDRVVARPAASAVTAKPSELHALIDQLRGPADAVDQALEVVAAEAPQLPQRPPDVRIIRGSSLDNAANLRADWIDAQRAKRGTQLGRQEVDGELLSGNPLTMFPFELLNRRRVVPDVEGLVRPEEKIRPGESVPVYLRRILDLSRICVALDPNGSEDPEAAEFGIQVVGMSRKGREYSLEDLSGHHSGFAWPRLAYETALLWRADAIVGEKNYGGNMIESALEMHVRGLIASGQSYLPVQYVGVTARDGKISRLKVFAQAVEAGLVYSVGPPEKWAALEAQLHAINPAEDPDKQVARIEVNGRVETLRFDRTDARVWAHLYLSGHESAKTRSSVMLGDLAAAKRTIDGLSF
jgi:phage terminase large subunit-like protein